MFSSLLLLSFYIRHINLNFSQLRFIIKDSSSSLFLIRRPPGDENKVTQALRVQHRPVLFKNTELKSSFGFVRIDIKKLSTLSSSDLSIKFNKDSINLNTSIPLKEDNSSLISVPVYKIYTDLQNKSVLSLMKEELKLKSGIYAFVHNETKKLYVGSSFNLRAGASHSKSDGDKRLNDYLNN